MSPVSCEHVTRLSPTITPAMYLSNSRFLLATQESCALVPVQKHARPSKVGSVITLKWFVRCRFARGKHTRAGADSRARSDSGANSHRAARRHRPCNISGAQPLGVGFQGLGFISGGHECKEYHAKSPIHLAPPTTSRWVAALASQHQRCASPRVWGCLYGG